MDIRHYAGLLWETAKKSSWPVTGLLSRGPLKDLKDSKLILNGINMILDDPLGLIYNQFGIIQVFQRSPIPQTSNWSGTFFCCFSQQTGFSGLSVFQTLVEQLCTNKIPWTFFSHIHISTTLWPTNLHKSLGPHQPLYCAMFVNMAYPIPVRLLRVLCTWWKSFCFFQLDQSQLNKNLT